MSYLDNLRGELSALDALLRQIPEGNVIERESLMGRKTEVLEEINSYEKKELITTAQKDVTKPNSFTFVIKAKVVTDTLLSAVGYAEEAVGKLHDAFLQFRDCKVVSVGDNEFHTEKVACNDNDGFLNSLAERCHETAKSKGWWDTDRNDLELIALMHSELSEAVEACRLGNPKSEKIPEFSALEEELADTLIRILDFTSYKGLDLDGAVKAKVEYNQGREYRHGNKAY